MSAHRAPSRSNADLYGPHINNNMHRAGSTEAAILALMQPDGAGLGSTDSFTEYGQHVDYISENQFKKEMTVIRSIFPRLSKEALEWAWLTQNSPLDYVSEVTA